jgi:cyanophycinase
LFNRSLCFRPLGRFGRCAVLLLAVSPALSSARESRYFRLGNSADGRSRTQGGFALVGGGADLDQAFTWMCARSGGGDFLVLRANGDDSYNKYVKGLCQANSVATLIVPGRDAAREPRVAETIRRAEALFIAGGDQANYINNWSGTPVQWAINEAIRRGIPVGGTSAGLAVLGEFVYSAQNDAPAGPNLSSARALANPYERQLTIVRGFLTNPLMKGVITDSHFTARDRLGRLLVFMARILQDQGVDQVKGIGIDERTAVLVDPSGQAQVAGAGAAYFLRATHKPEVCRPGAPLTFRGVEERETRAGDRFDLLSWTGKGGTTASLSAESGSVRSYPGPAGADH